MRLKRIARYASFISTVLLAIFSGPGAAYAANNEEAARAQCREKFVPVVKDCVRQKVMASGGSPAQYIPGCRAAIMDQARECVMKLMAAAGAREAATTALGSETDIAPPSGKGRVVIVLSGIDGPGPVQDYANKVAQLGYFTVLLDGNAILSEDRQGGTRLAQVIAKAQASPNALPGKVAVIGFAVGGGGALAYAEAQPNTVASVIAYDPVTAFIAKVGGMKAFVGNFQVPLLAFAAAQDKFKDCCLLATIQDMQTTAKALNKPMELIVYPNADHNFSFSGGPTYRQDDADDAWKHTTDALHQAFGDAAAH
jgi:carboxymethylenebutenolidase